MIPKVIHYCWFGGNPLPDLALRCIESWKRYNPDYEIIRWDEDNYDINADYYTAEAYRAKKWAFLSDYARLKIVYENGGIYLDTDVEVVKPFDELLENKCFLGADTDGCINTGLGFGAEKGNIVVKNLLDVYRGKHLELARGIYNDIPCPFLNTPPIKRMGYEYSREAIWKGREVTVYPPEYFCPIEFRTGEQKMTHNTISIHHFSASWVTERDREIEKVVEEVRGKYSGIRYLVEKQRKLYIISKRFEGIGSYPQYVFNRARQKLVYLFKGWN